MRFLPFQPRTAKVEQHSEEQVEVDVEESASDGQASQPNTKQVRPQQSARERHWLHVLAGGLIGLVIGAWRSLLLLTGAFLFMVLLPQTPYAASVQQSLMYEVAIKAWIEPFSGEFIQSKVPVWTEALEQNLQDIIRKKYALVDAQIPPDVSEAARAVTVRAATDEERARALYHWIGTRVTYDWDKVNLYERQNVWREQTPEDTFHTRKGVCIDYARLYAVMARAVGLEVRIVTGLGYDGRGGYGPHAWNEVQITPGKWVPLDATWHSSGRDWFNPADFYDTHVKQETL
jgi:hypothetical protein